MCDDKGNLITSEDQIEKLALNTYKKRLENRPIRENLSELKRSKEELCYRRLEKAKNKTTPPWTMDQLDNVLNYLKKNKCRDPYGYINEIFRPEVAGKDLKLALLKLMNIIKIDQTYPEALELYDVSSIWKRKGSRNEFDN